MMADGSRLAFHAGFWGHRCATHVCGYDVARIRPRRRRARRLRARCHASHQSGRDADLGYYYKPGYQAWYQPASVYTMDRARSWAFVRALVTETDVEAIFIDMRVQRLLYEYALSAGEDRAWLDGLFGFM